MAASINYNMKKRSNVRKWDERSCRDRVSSSTVVDDMVELVETKAEATCVLEIGPKRLFK